MLVDLPAQGVFWPPFPPHEFSNAGGAAYIALASAVTIDAAGEKCALTGHLHMAGRATSKTFSSAGGKIHVRLGTTTFASASSALSVGIQDVSTAAGPTIQPDGTFDVSAEYIGGTDTLTTGAWNSIAMETGTRSLSHGDLISVVFDLTARGGTDSIIIAGLSASIGGNLPAVSAFTTAWGSNPTAAVPVVVLEMDDGTLATLAGSFPCTAATNLAYAAASNPDEYALIFQVPFACQIDALWGAFYAAANTADFELVLYSDPLGTPTALATVTGDGNWIGSTSARLFVGHVASPVTLAKDTTYAVALKATGAGNITLSGLQLRNAADRDLIWGTTFQRGSRQNATGAFGSLTTTEHQYLGVRIRKLDDGRGGGLATYAIGV